MYKSKKRGCEFPQHRRAANGWLVLSGLFLLNS